MASVATKTRIDTVQEYFKRQYETEEGTTQENVDAVVSDDVVYHRGDGKLLSKEALVELADRIRRSPKADRVVELSDLREKGECVSFHIHIKLRDPDSGKLVDMENDNTWRFDPSGKVVEVTPGDPKRVDEMVGELGIDPEKR